ncbi:sulfatase-like hydrolase/transferase, partial [bacterium]|nr:sulfatase-like hydrolase/transferase [bacterium]
MPPRRIPHALALVAALATVSCGRGPEPGALAGWNVLLVTIDTLRADRVGFAGYRGAHTPTMDGLAGEGVVLDNVVASAPVTLPSHATILSGLYPPRHGALDNGFYSLPEDVPTLATILRDAGYRTGAFLGAAVLAKRYGLARGFDEYDDRIQGKREMGHAYRERRAAEVSRLAAAWVRGGNDDRPFFAWVHYYDPHASYAPPARYAKRFAGNPYDGEVAYTDAALGTLLEELRADGRLGKTLVIVTADHGEAFGDGGELTHGFLLRESTLRVPLILSAPGMLPAARRIAGVTPTADIVPTVLDLLGEPVPEGLDGESLLPAIGRGRTRDRYAYSETRLPTDLFGWAMLSGVRGRRWAWVRAPRPELYDLQADPAEARNLDGTRDELATSLDGRVQEVLDRSREADAAHRLDAEQLETLRSLGYVFSEERAEETGEDPKDMLPVLEEINLVMNHFDAGNHADVVTVARSVLAKDPDNVDTLRYLALSQEQLGRREEAIGSLRRAMGAGGSPDLEGTLLAMFLTRAGRFDEAERLLRSFAEADPDFAEHPYNLGNLLASRGRMEEARRAYERAFALDPNSVPITANLASVISKATGGRPDRERAIELIDRAVGLAQGDDRPRLMKVEICTR